MRATVPIGGRKEHGLVACRFFFFLTTQPLDSPPHEQALLRDTPLIPVELLYGQPVAADPQISPDGAWLSFLAPSPPNNTLNVFVAPLRNSSSPSEPSQELPPRAFQLTRETAFDIDPGQYQWSPDSRFVLYLFDRDPRVGDQYRLWRKDITKPEAEAVDLIPEFSTARRSEIGGAAAAPSNRTLPPGLMGDKLHIGQFFLSEKVPVREGKRVERQGEREGKNERKKNSRDEKNFPQKISELGPRSDYDRRALSGHL